MATTSTTTKTTKIEVLGFPWTMAAAWTWAASLCVAHVVWMWWMPPALVSSVHGSTVGERTWRLVDAWFAKPMARAEAYVSSRPLWLAAWLVVRIALFVTIQGPLQIVLDVLADPDSARLLAACVLAPLAAAAVWWTVVREGTALSAMAALAPLLPAGWVDPTSTSQRVAWVSLAVVGSLCFLLEALQFAHPPTVRLLVGASYSGPESLWKLHVAVAASCAVACAFAGLHHVNPKEAASKEAASIRRNDRETLLDYAGYLLAASTAIVAAILVVKAIF